MCVIEIIRVYLQIKLDINFCDIKYFKIYLKVKYSILKDLNVSGLNVIF